MKKYLLFIFLILAKMALADTSPFILRLRTAGEKIENTYKAVQESEKAISTLDEKIQYKNKSNKELKKVIEDIEEEAGSIKQEINGLRNEINDFKNSLDDLKKNKKVPEISRSLPLKERLKRKTDSQYREYRVRPGDTLSSISLFMYGNSGMWKKIYNANSDKINNPSSLRVGQVLRIP